MAEGFEDFIEQAFIDPIRSVVIVDDDYPTIEEVLDSPTETDVGTILRPSKKDWRRAPDDVLRVVREFRSDEKKYIFDVHDGQTFSHSDELNGAAHLHQTDLLVLDYELDPDNPGDNSRSLGIARKLFNSDHFNLIIVNTNKSLDEVFEKFLLGLLEKDQLRSLSLKDQALVEEAYNETDLPDNFTDGLEKNFGFRQYAAVVGDRKNLQKLKAGKEEFAGSKDLFKSAGLHQKYWRAIAMSALLEYQSRLAVSLSFGDRSYGVSSFRDSGAVKWIRSSRGFITFSHKPERRPLIGVLRAALADWRPKPSRLLLAKMSADIESQGVEMQDRALADDYSSALWFHNLLLADEFKLKSEVDGTVRRHVDEMVTQVLPGVQGFGSRLVASQRKQTQELNTSVVQAHYRVDLNDDRQLLTAQLHHNALVCGEEVRGWHIQAGHIIAVADEMWACVSPLCDTVPSQKSDGALGKYKERLRISVMRLHNCKPNRMPSNLNSNRHLFFKSGDDVEIYSIGQDSKSNPQIEYFYLEGRGIFSNDFKLKLSRPEISKTKRGVSMKTHEGQVKYQLRSEYAHNLIQNFGTAATRIGLDYIGS